MSEWVTSDIVSSPGSVHLIWPTRLDPDRVLSPQPPRKGQPLQSIIHPGIFRCKDIQYNFDTNTSIHINRRRHEYGHIKACSLLEAPISTFTIYFMYLMLKDLYFANQTVSKVVQMPIFDVDSNISVKPSRCFNKEKAQVDALSEYCGYRCKNWRTLGNVCGYVVSSCRSRAAVLVHVNGSWTRSQWVEVDVAAEGQPAAQLGSVAGGQGWRRQSSSSPSWSPLVLLLLWYCMQRTQNHSF